MKAATDLYHRAASYGRHEGAKFEAEVDAAVDGLGVADLHRLADAVHAGAEVRRAKGAEAKAKAVRDAIIERWGMKHRSDI